MIKYFIYFIIISLFISFAGLFFYYKSEVERLQNNYDVLALNKDNAEVYHKNEVKKYYSSIDSLRKALNVREKTVQVVFKTKYNYKDSTMFNFKDSTIYVNDTIPFFIKTKHIQKPCYDLHLYNVNDTITSILNYHNVFTGIFHWEFPHKFLFIRWGKKEYYLKLYSECQKDTIKVDKLIMIK